MVLAILFSFFDVGGFAEAGVSGPLIFLGLLAVYLVTPILRHKRYIPCAVRLLEEAVQPPDMN